MLQNFRDRHPVYFSLTHAAFAAGFGYLCLMFGADWDSTRMPSDAAIRICFLVATVLLMEDVLDGCSIALSQHPTPRSPHFWMFAFYMSYFWFIWMTLVLWMEAFADWGLLISFVSSQLFGVVIATFLKKASRRENTAIVGLCTRYNLDKPANRFLYFAMPCVLTCVLLIGIIQGKAMPATTQIDNNSFAFTPMLTVYLLIFCAGLMPRYQRQNNGSLGAKIGGTKLLGLMLLSGGYFFLEPN